MTPPAPRSSARPMAAASLAGTRTSGVTSPRTAASREARADPSRIPCWQSKQMNSTASDVRISAVYVDGVMHHAPTAEPPLASTARRVSISGHLGDHQGLDLVEVGLGRPADLWRAPPVDGLADVAVRLGGLPDDPADHGGVLAGGEQRLEVGGPEQRFEDLGVELGQGRVPAPVSDRLVELTVPGAELLER